ncbi:MAG: YebC/PmpR family DNA-binding transcriptional regulator [Gammaproteobacteria bacterium]
MAGHSKWKNIQHRKGAQDAKRGKVFTKLIREITKSAELGGGDPGANPRLRVAIDKALSNNMTRETVDNAIKRGVGGLDSANVEELTYEGYGPGGVAVMVECMTDNRNRTAAEVRHAFTKCGGNLGTDGSVAYLFAKKGQLIFAPGNSEDRILEVALEAGAEDVITSNDGSIEVVTAPAEFQQVKSALEQAGLTATEGEVTYLPSTYAELDEEATEKMLKMIDMLEDLDDVQSVYSNL